MKIRRGHVSNSSSSSFIISCPKDLPIKDLKGTVQVEVNLAQYISENSDYHEVIDSYDELEKYIMSNYGWRRAGQTAPLAFQEVINDNSDARDKYLEFSKILEKGDKVMCGSIASDGGGDLDYFLSEAGLNTMTNCNFDIIEGEGGY